MTRSILLGLISFVAYQTLSAQPDFQRLYRSAANAAALANSIVSTSDGGYIMAGRDSSKPAQDYDAYLVKTAANGDTLWARSYGTAGYEYGQYAIQSSDGGYLLAGITVGATADVYLVKTDANGDTLWTRILVQSGDDEANFVQQANDGNFIVAGYTNSSGAGSYDYFLVKVGINGNILWSKTYGTPLDELAYTVFQAADKGYIVAGAAMTPGSTIDVYAVKTDSTGIEQWSKYYGTTNTDWGYMMRPTSDGGFILTGYAGTSAGSLDALLIKTDAAGDTLWTGTYGGSNFEQGLAVIETNTGGYAVSGSVYDGSLGGSDAMLLRTDNLGHMLYCRGFGGSGDDWAPSLLQLNDNSFVLGGYTNSLSAGSYDFYMVRTDTAGNTVANCNESLTTVQQTQAAISVTSLTTTVLPFALNAAPGITAVDSRVTQAEGCGSLGTSQSQGGRLLLGVYPNPSSGAFSVRADHVSSATVSLIVQDMVGKQLYSEIIPNESGTIIGSVQLNGIAPGVYFVRLVAGNNTWTAKLMVIK